MRGVGVAAVDKLAALHQTERLQLVAVARGFFKLQIGGGLLHFVLQSLAQHIGAAVEKSGGFFHCGAVVVCRNRAHARRGAALDLVQQAGALAVGKHAVFAGAQLEHFLQHLDAVAHRVAIGIGAEILVRLFQAAPVVGHLRELMAGEHQIGIGFVVAKQNIIFGRQRLNQIVFQNQRLGFAAGNGNLHPHHLLDHQRDARRVAGGFLEIARHSPLQVHRLAHIQHRAVGGNHAVHPRQRGQGFQKQGKVKFGIGRVHGGGL